MSEEAAVETEATENTTPAGEGGVDSPVPEAPPEWVPEKFLVDGAPDFEKMAGAYRDLERKMHTRTDDLFKKEKESWEAERLAGRPETKDHYEINTPEGFEINADSEMLNWWKEFAFDSGLGQEGFDKGIEMYMSELSANQTNPEIEMENLGENARERIEAVSLWAGKNLSDGAYKAVAAMAATSKGVEALEELMGLATGSGIKTGIGEVSETNEITRAEIVDQMSNPLYRETSEAGKAHRAKVSAMWEQLHPGETQVAN